VTYALAVSGHNYQLYDALLSISRVGLAIANADIRIWIHDVQPTRQADGLGLLVDISRPWPVIRNRIGCWRVSMSPA
jgi:hypothetical protein